MCHRITKSWTPYKIWYKRGKLLTVLDRDEEAIASYDRAIQIKPDYDTWHEKGLSLTRLQRYEEAIASYDKAIQINPEYAFAWYNKACCYAKQNRVDLATETLKQAINLDPR